MSLTVSSTLLGFQQQSKPEQASIENALKDLYSRKIWHIEHQTLAYGLSFRVKALIQSSQSSLIHQVNLIPSLENFSLSLIETISKSVSIDFDTSRPTPHETQIQEGLLNVASCLGVDLKTPRVDKINAPSEKKEPTKDTSERKEEKECKRVPSLEARVSKIQMPVDHPYYNVCTHAQADQVLKNKPRAFYYHLLCAYLPVVKNYFVLKIKRLGYSQISNYFLEFNPKTGWFECARDSNQVIRRVSHKAYLSVDAFFAEKFPFKSTGIKI